MKPEAPLTHPGADEWSAFLYGELPPEQHAALEAHRAGCPACATQVEQWRETMATLDRWQVPARPASARPAATWLRWAVAACFLLAAGTIVGRLTAPRVDLGQLRAELRQQSQADLQAALKVVATDNDRRLDELAQAWAAGRAQDQQAMLTLYQRADTQHKSDVTRLRRDLETVALTADERLETTQRGLSQLAAVSQAAWQRNDPPSVRP